jgi:predicted transcriptional regulator
MNIENEKKILIEWLSKINDESLIEKIMLLKENFKDDDWWQEISEEEKASIERGLEDSAKGHVISHDSVKKNYEKWL